MGAQISSLWDSSFFKHWLKCVDCLFEYPFFLNQQAMDLTMSALVSPAKLISSMAPVLLEHVFTLRLVSGGSSARTSNVHSCTRRVLEDQRKYLLFLIDLDQLRA